MSTTKSSSPLHQTDQLKQLKDIFNRFDMDSDGSLTLLELAALLRSLGVKPSGDELHALLSKIDHNNNGYVEFNELHALIPNYHDDDDDTNNNNNNNNNIFMNQQQLLELFRMFDRDGNGFITAAELAGSMAKMGHPLTYRELASMMKQADSNGDGVTSFEEFVTILAKSAADFLGIKVIA